MSKRVLLPSQLSEELGFKYTSSKSIGFKKSYGQYLTPIAVANFMAKLIKRSKQDISILDPGAGTGILCCALLEHLSTVDKPPKNIRLVAYEIDEGIIPYLKQSLDYLKLWLGKKNITLTYLIKEKDFIVDNSNSFVTEEVLFPLGNSLERFDYIISNPPYFKLSKSDLRSKIASKIVHGQPNIYAIFMMVSALLLKNDGELIFISPRSFTSGLYFKTFREHFFTIVQPNYIHLFDSRSDTFDKDAVLQENIILKAVKDHIFEKPNTKVTISFSRGIKDLYSAMKRNIPVKEVINLKTRNKVVRILATEKEDQVVQTVHAWKDNLHSLGLNISTGPVVAFRALKYISNKKNGHRYAPLLWMQNVKAMDVKWPINRKKQQFIEDNEDTRRLLVPNKNYIILRRFSTKEESKRIVAAPHVADSIKSETLGLENHLNYIYKPNGTLSLEETMGLAALLNSNLLDIYFRTSNGSTQVNATELRDIPLPSAQKIVEIGKKVLKNSVNKKLIDNLINKNLVNTQ